MSAPVCTRLLARRVDRPDTSYVAGREGSYYRIGENYTLTIEPRRRCRYRLKPGKRARVTEANMVFADEPYPSEPGPHRKGPVFNFSDQTVKTRALRLLSRADP